MKRLLKKVLATVVALTVCVTGASAFSTNDLEAEGWTRVSDLSDVSNNYYVFVDAGSSSYAIGRLSSGTDRPVYQNLADPLGFKGVVWKLDGTSSYTFQNLFEIEQYLLHLLIVNFVLYNQ